MFTYGTNFTGSITNNIFSRYIFTFSKTVMKLYSNQFYIINVLVNNRIPYTQPRNHVSMSQGFNPYIFLDIHSDKISF